MKKFISLLLLTLIIGGLLLSVTSCSDKESRKKDDNVLIVGIDDAFPPMTYKDKNGEIVGFDVDMGNEIGKRIGKELQWQKSDWDTITTSLKNKDIDLVICGMTITPERKEAIGFSNPYINSGIEMVTKKDSKLKKIGDTKGKIIGVQRGSSGYEALINSGYKENIQEYENYALAMEDLKIGRLDVVAIDKITAVGFMNEEKDTYKVLDGVITGEQFGIAFRKEDSELQKEINKALEDMKADGTLDALAEKWFGAENAKGAIAK